MSTKSKIGEFFEYLLEAMGHPVGVHRLLEQSKDVRWRLPLRKVIDEDTVVQWHKWSRQPLLGQREPGILLGWKQSGRDYRSFKLPYSGIVDLVDCRVIENWQCDILEVEGLSAARFSLDFASLDELVTAESPDLVDAITVEKLEENLAWGEIRILHSPGVDHFTLYLWDGRIILNNKGGAHHFSAARYIAARIPKSVSLTGALHIYSINPVVLVAMRRDFEFFVLPYKKEFHETMKAFRATYFECWMPRPHERAQVIFLPKDEPRSAAVSEVMRNAGIFNLGEYLVQAVSQQPAIDKYVQHEP